MAGVTVDPGVINTEALTAVRVLAMNDEISGLRDLVQQGNMIPGLNQIANQVIRLTQHGVALHSRVDGLIAISDRVSNTAEGIKASIVSLADEVEGKLAAPVAAKIAEIEAKSVQLTQDVSKAIEGINDAFVQRDNQTFMDHGYQDSTRQHIG